jgi:hypothetical protein
MECVCCGAKNSKELICENCTRDAEQAEKEFLEDTKNGR